MQFFTSAQIGCVDISYLCANNNKITIIMPANKNALIRYKTIDNCLRNRYRRWTLEDLVDACSDALYDMEGIRKGVSVRTVQGDIQMMRSDKLGYNAPIEVYDHKYYRYADSDYSITDMPMSQNDYEVMKEAVDMLRQLQDFDQFAEMSDVVNRLQDLKIMYQSFTARRPTEFILCPYLLKEFRNRWFLFGSKADDLLLFNLPLDRMVSAEPVDIPFRENPEFDSEHFFDDVIGVSKNIHERAECVKFWASAEQSRYIKTKPLHPSQCVISENPTDGSCIFRIDVVINFEMYSVFMSYGAGVKILSPRRCLNYMSKTLKAAASLYDQRI